VRLVAVALAAALLCPLSGCRKRPQQVPLTQAAEAVAEVPPAAAEIKKPAKVPAAATPTGAPPSAAGDARLRFNRDAAARFVPAFWRADTNKDGKPQADELAHLWGFGLLPAWPTVYDEVNTAATTARAAAKGRAALVLQELDQGMPTLIETDLAKDSPAERGFVKEILAAAVIVERLYHRQRGVLALAGKVTADDPASRMLFHRNQGPWCGAPKTEKNPDCSALAERPQRISGLYPAAVQKNPKFCDELTARKDGRALMHQFHAVRSEGDKLVAVPFSKAWPEDMAAAAAHLDKAAAAMAAVKSEAALVAYLRAAAKAFRDDSWPTADEAWAKMNARNSKWYLRIGPDEVYFEPCNRKAGFHVSFARINTDSLRWQDKLDPLKQDMEKDLAALAGAPYKARKVSFSLPDFIDIVINAGDSRSAHGATIGQSLPNWGPVANEGRGRTVAMTNLYTDADSVATFRKQSESLVCRDMLGLLTFDQEPQVMSTVLHEAAHNLGPAHEYKVGGKKGPEVFGGPLASTMEELKAQTAALWLNGWLLDRKVIDRKMSASAYGRDILWAFGHISRGMWTNSGKPKPYAQLAAIQVGFMLDRKGLTWRKDEVAANGKDKGCMSLDPAAFRKASDELMKIVAGIKSRGDKKAALALRATYTADKGDYTDLRALIRGRWLRAPKASFVYSVKGL